MKTATIALLTATLLGNVIAAPVPLSPAAGHVNAATKAQLNELADSIKFNKLMSQIAHAKRQLGVGLGDDELIGGLLDALGLGDLIGGAAGAVTDTVGGATGALGPILPARRTIDIEAIKEKLKELSESGELDELLSDAAPQKRQLGVGLGDDELIGGLLDALGLGDLTDTVSNTVGGAAGAVTDTVGSAAGGIVRRQLGLGLGDDELIGGLLDTLGLGGATDAVTDTLGGATGAVTDTLGGATGAVTDTLGGATGAVADTVGGVTSKLPIRRQLGLGLGDDELVGGLLDGLGLGGATDAVTDTVGGAAGAVTDTVGGAAGAVTDTLGGATGAVTDTLGGATGAVTDTVGGAADAVADTAGDAVGAVGETAGDAAGAVTDAAGAATGAVTDAAGAVTGGRQVKRALIAKPGGQLGETLGPLTDTLGNTVEGATDAVEGATDAVEDTLGGVTDTVGNTAGRVV